jgi:alpha,alpha-trehalase
VNQRYFGAVGNGERVALVGPGLEVTAMGPGWGASLALSFGWEEEEPAALSEVRQRYRGRTNILETCALGGELAAVVVDSMPWGRRYLARRIALTNGGTRRRKVQVAFEPDVLPDRVWVAFKGPDSAELAPGETLTTLLVLAYGDTPAEARRAWEAAAGDDLETEERFWEGWLAPARQVECGEPDLEEFYWRSLLTLKLLCRERTGAGPHGEALCRALDAAGLHAESHRFYESALGQTGSEAGVLHGLWCHWRAIGDRALMGACWEQIRQAAERVMAGWKLEAGRVQHRARMASGLHAAAEIADGLGHPEEAVRWGEEALTVREEVLAKGWSDERHAYLQSYESGSGLHAGALAVSLEGLLPPDDARLQSTVAVMEQPVRVGGLSHGGAITWHEGADMPAYLPTLWLARHYLRAGGKERALELVRLCLAGATVHGLLAERFDPRSGEQWGDCPDGRNQAELALTLLELFGEPAYRARELYMA